MLEVTMKALINAGAHFGHQTSRWNPKMKKYIFGSRNGIHIINLQRTVENLKPVADFVQKLGTEGKTILFVGTKKQAHEIVAEAAARCNAYYINHRWMGGTLTNMNAIKNSINRLTKIETMAADGTFNLLPKKEVAGLEKDKIKLKKAVGGIQKMAQLPDALFVIDPQYEMIAVKEARCLGIPVIAITDTNCDPDLVDYVIPGNDDAIRSIKIFSDMVADAYNEGFKKFRVKVNETETAQKHIQEKAKSEGAPARRSLKSSDKSKPAGEEPVFETKKSLKNLKATKKTT